MILIRNQSVHAFPILIFVACAVFLTSESAPAQVQRVVTQRTATAPKSTAPAFIKIRVVDGRVSAEIRNAPLQDVLEELAARSGIVFEIQTQQNPVVSQIHDKADMAEAIQRILGDTSDTIFQFTKDSSGQDRIGLVRVFPRGNQLQQPGLRFIGLGKVTKTGEDSPESPEQAATILEESKDLGLRQKAIEVLAMSKSESSTQALIKALSDPAPEIKAAAIDGLASQESSAALPKIVLALKDTHPGVRQSAIAAISLMGNASNVKDLTPLSQDSDANVAMAAEMAIRKLSGQQ